MIVIINIRSGAEIRNREREREVERERERNMYILYTYIYIRRERTRGPCGRITWYALLEAVKQNCFALEYASGGRASRRWCWRL